MASGKSHLVLDILSLAGFFLAAVGLLGSLLVGARQFFSKAPSIGGSLLAWIILPVVCVLGLCLITAAFLLHRNQLRRDPSLEPSSRLLLGLPQACLRGVVLGHLLAVTCILAWAVLAGRNAYHYTESTEFCAASCHVMEPERVTHQISPHASVSCAECHIGKTAGEYVEAKLFGVKELYWLMSGTYSRPIETPIQIMNPVRENCTGCHWEGQYWGKMHRDYSHYITANDNQLWSLKMNVKVGGMYRSGDEGEGIHWHMKLSPNVFYRAKDKRLQDIPWVKIVGADGEEVLYQSTEDPIPEEEWDQYDVREMTCVDCHNRPAHQFKAPILAIDSAIARGTIDPALPEIKAKGVEFLAAPYSTQQEAAASIREQLVTFYQGQYPQLLETDRGKIERAADVLVKLYRQNFFPEMKSDWRSYPDQIGHFLSDGCFRCHDGLHRSSDGRTISNDCTLCHDIVVQGPVDDREADPDGLPFRHPVDFGMPVQELGKCTGCHDGALGGL